MKEIPTNVSESTKKRNPHLYGPRPCPPDRDPMFWREDEEVSMHFHGQPVKVKLPKLIRQRKKPPLNETEQRYCDVLTSRGFQVLKQAITFRLDPPYKSYKPDLAYWSLLWGITFVEVKGPHRFRKAGIAKAALAAKTYPKFRFELADWINGQWKESVLSP